MSCGDENVKSVKVQEENQKNALKDHFYRLHFVMFQINMFLEYESRDVVLFIVFKTKYIFFSSLRFVFFHIPKGIPQLQNGL